MQAGETFSVQLFNIVGRVKKGSNNNTALVHFKATY